MYSILQIDTGNCLPKTGAAEGGARWRYKAMSEIQVFRGELGLAGEAHAQLAQRALVAGVQHAGAVHLAVPQAAAAAAMARAVMRVGGGCDGRVPRSTSSTFKTLERLPRMSIFSLRIGSSMMGLMSMRESSMPAMRLDGVEHAGGARRSSGCWPCPLRSGPSGSWMAAAATPASLLLLARAGRNHRHGPAVVREQLLHDALYLVHRVRPSPYPACGRKGPCSNGG